MNGIKMIMIAALRLVSVYLFVQALGQTFAFISMFPFIDIDTRLSSGAFFGYVSIPYIVAVLLWVLAPTIAIKLTTHTDTNIDESGLVKVGGFLLGVYLAVTYSGKLIGSGASGLEYGKPVLESILLSDALVLLAGIVLVVFPKILLHAYKKVLAINNFCI